MIDFFELEKKCKAKQRKKIIKISIFVLVFIIIIISIFIFFYTSKSHSSKAKHPIKIIKKLKHKIVKTEKQKKIIKISKSKQKPEIMPTLKPIINLSSIPTNILPQLKKPKPKPIKKEIIKKQPIVLQQPKEPKLIVSNPISFSYALHLAQKYYKQKDYTNSMLWCKRAAQINNSNDKVWQLYALNLYQTGNKQKAIEVLKTYLKYQNSIEIQYLLQRLEK